VKASGYAVDVPASPRSSRRLSLVTGIAGAAVVAAHALVFLRYLPNANGGVGSDYSYFLVQLLDGYFWSHVNGYASVPWFTPGFCGGLPKFPNPQALYFSVPQLLTNLVDPLTSVRVTFVLFGALGYVGCFLLLRRTFSASHEAAWLGATLFLFNGLFAARMLIGHLTFHGFMLVPLLCLALDAQPLQRRAAGGFGGSRGIRVSGAALILAYLATTGLPVVLFQALLIVILLALCAALVREAPYPWRAFALELMAAGGIAIGIAAAKLVAVASFLEQFPRNLYPLPGIQSPLKLLWILALSLFSTPPLASIREAVVNAHWGIDVHEFEFGLTPVPLVIIVLALGAGFSLRAASTRWKRTPTAKRLVLVSLGTLLCAPLALNFYQSEWNALLKATPMLASSSGLFRWWSVYIPVVCVCASLCLDREPRLARHRRAIAIAGVLIVIGLSVARDRSDYAARAFDPHPVAESYERVRSGAWAPRVERIAVARDGAGNEALVKFRNLTLANGESQLLCYEPLFGYRLENFPRNSLRGGSVMQEQDGFLNLKNPACYVYPRENGCLPGDQFRSDQRSQAEAFAAYRPFDFAASTRQRLANATSLISSAGVLLFLLVRLASRARGVSTG